MTGQALGHLRGDGGPAAVLAVDVGNRKTDLALVAANGALIAALRGPTASHQAVGLERGVDRLVGLALAAARSGGMPVADGPPAADEIQRARGDAMSPHAPASRIARVGSFCLAGADTPRDVRRLTRAIGRRGLVADVLVRNDTDAGLRAGSPDGWGVVLVCGEGFNCLGVHPDGRSARLLALGEISGDWGGGLGLGQAALAAALRGRDRRGPRTALEGAVPAFFGLRRPLDVTQALYTGRLAERRLGELAPVVFTVAADGDAESRAIADRLADELAGAAIAAARRLRLVRAAVPVVLAGGVFRTDEKGFNVRLRERIHAALPRATVVRLDVPPVAGAALLGLDRLAVPASALERCRAELTEERLVAVG